MTPDEAVASAHTGDVWLFRGHTAADRAIRLFTNSPVNHVAMVVALDDLPPLLWHTELGQSLESVWTGEHHRGAQLNRLDEALEIWTGKYHQRAFVRHFDGEITHDAEDSALAGDQRVRGSRFPANPSVGGEVALGPTEARGVGAGRVLRGAPCDHVHPNGLARSPHAGELV